MPSCATAGIGSGAAPVWHGQWWTSPSPLPSWRGRYSPGVEMTATELLEVHTAATRDLVAVTVATTAKRNRASRPPAVPEPELTCDVT